MTLVRLLLMTFVVGSACAVVPASAEPCGSEFMNTYQRLECAEIDAKKAESQVQDSYKDALATAKAAMAKCDLHIDFGPEIRETQRLWKRWVGKECELEGGMNNVVAPFLCRQRLALERAKALDEIANGLRCKFIARRPKN